MAHIPKTISVSDLHANYNQIFAELGEDTGPTDYVIIHRRGEPLAVMVSPATWNALQDRLKGLTAHDG